MSTSRRREVMLTVIPAQERVKGSRLGTEERRCHSVPLPLVGRGIAYGFERSIALVGKKDSEDDSRIVVGVGCEGSRRFSGGCRTRARTTRDTICWKCCSLLWRQCCVGRTPARTWPTSDDPRKGCCGFFCA